MDAIGAPDPGVGLEGAQQIYQGMDARGFVPVQAGKNRQAQRLFALLVGSAKNHARQPIALLADMPETGGVRAEGFGGGAHLKKQWQEQLLDRTALRRARLVAGRHGLGRVRRIHQLS